MVLILTGHWQSSNPHHLSQKPILSPFPASEDCSLLSFFPAHLKENKLELLAADSYGHGYFNDIYIFRISWSANYDSRKMISKVFIWFWCEKLEYDDEKSEHMYSMNLYTNLQHTQFERGLTRSQLRSYYRRWIS